MTPSRDRELGLDRAITRRDFLCGSAALMGASALASCRGSQESGQLSVSFEVGESWYGPGGVGDYASSHGNTPEVLRVAHLVREGAFDLPSEDATLDSDDPYDVVIVGGGISGLSAAHHFRRLSPRGRALVLDNHPIFGGEAKRNEFLVNGHLLKGPQGSNDFGVLPETGDPDDYFTSLGIPREFAYQEPGGDAQGLRIPFDHYSYLHWKADAFDVAHFFHGDGAELLNANGRSHWVRNLWDRDPQEIWSEGAARAVAAWRNASARDHAPEKRGRGASSDEAAVLGPWLDSMTVKEYYETVLGLPPRITHYVDPILASIIGLGCDAISAWWGWYFQLPGFRNESRYTGFTFHAFPGGNAGIARYFVKGLLPDAVSGSASLADVVGGAVDFAALDRQENPVRLRMGATVVRVEHEPDERVSVTYMKDGRPHRVLARGVVMASGGWINRHVLRDLPEEHRKAYEGFRHSPVLVANVALNNWRFLAKLGAGCVIWNGGFGFSCNIRRPMILGGQASPFHPDEPTVMTFYVPLFSPGMPAMNQGQAGRLALLQTPFVDYERQLREQMSLLFADQSFDAANDIAGIILNRWGHAYINPEPGFFFGVGGQPSVSDVIRKPFGRIAIGHSELRGHQNWTGAAAEGRRAVEALLG